MSMPSPTPTARVPQQLSKTQARSNQSHHVKNLGTIFVHFVGLELMVELKNGRIYCGTLHEADDYMNLVLNKNGSASSIHLAASVESDEIDFKMIHIRGPSIRYVHFPANADLPRLVKLGLDRVKAANDKYNRGKRSKRSPTT